MSGEICRLKSSKGEPVDLSIFSRSTILDLPREIRNKIYRYSLVAVEPITVRSGTKSNAHKGVEEDSVPVRVSLTSSIAVGQEVIALYDLSLGLLRCNRIIAAEAAAVFYRWNTFRFEGDGNWNSLYVFLQMIGNENRVYLQNLEIGILQPRRVWQHSDRNSQKPYLFRKVLACYRHPRAISENNTGGMVDNVDPAIEACFRILGKDGPALTLVIRTLPNRTFPGMQLWYDEQRPDCDRWSMELPDIIEMFKQDYTAKSGKKCRVEVLWKGDCPRAEFTKKQDAIQKVGWEILEAKAGEVNHYNYKTIVLSTLYTLRRRSGTEA